MEIILIVELNNAIYASVFCEAEVAIPFFFIVRIVELAIFRRTFLPLITKVFFCIFGLRARLVLRCEFGITLLPNCLPLPVISHLAILKNSFS